LHFQLRSFHQPEAISFKIHPDGKNDNQEQCQIPVNEENQEIIAWIVESGADLRLFIDFKVRMEVLKPLKMPLGSKIVTSCYTE